MSLPEIPVLPIQKRANSELDRIALSIEQILKERARLLQTDKKVIPDRQATTVGKRFGFPARLPYIHFDIEQINERRSREKFDPRTRQLLRSNDELVEANTGESIDDLFYRKSRKKRD